VKPLRYASQCLMHRTCVSMYPRQFLYRAFFLGLVLLLLAGCDGEKHDAGPGEPLRVLFIGNSYTFYNDLPQMFAQLARSGGCEIEADMSAVGGWTLSDHATSAETLGKLQTQDWDYVLLQEQSVIPSLQHERDQHMVPAARALDEKIRQAGADTVMFMTWGRRDGLQAEGYPDFDSMQDQLYAGYMEIADELDAIVAPVGFAWQNSTAQQPHLNLWNADGSHPGGSGSYLTACVLYAVLCQRSPEGLAYVAGLAEDVARFLQGIAAETVLQSPERWNIR
jgi:hypothetical protein